MIINGAMAEGYFIAKVFRQKNSLVIVVPMAVRVALDMQAGDHVVFTWSQARGKFKFSKFVPVGDQDGRASGDSDSGDQGGRA